MSREKIGNIVRIMRSTRGLSQSELARQAGISSRTLGNIESGRRQPKVHTLLAVLAALKCSLVVIKNETL